MEEGAASALRAFNRERVLASIRTGKGSSRADLMRVTGLGRTTIAGLVAELLRDGLIVEQGSFAELLSRNGFFSYLYNLQAWSKQAAEA